jgi:hypothetical protein
MFCVESKGFIGKDKFTGKVSIKSRSFALLRMTNLLFSME